MGHSMGHSAGQSMGQSMGHSMGQSWSPTPSQVTTQSVSQMTTQSVSRMTTQSVSPTVSQMTTQESSQSTGETSGSLWDVEGSDDHTQSTQQSSLEGSEQSRGERQKMNKKKTLFETAIQNATQSDLLQFAKSSKEYEEITKSKNAWAREMYEDFCAQYGGGNVYPIEAEKISAFIRFLGKSAKYSFYSITDVIIPSLLRVNVHVTGNSAIDSVVQAIKEAVMELKSNPLVKKPQLKKEPAIAPDVETIIKRTPDVLVTKAEEASLWIFALMTGARAFTCAHMVLTDITTVKKSATGTTLITIKMDYAKFKRNWGHSVTLEGDYEEEKVLDFVKWLRLHLQENFNLDLDDYAHWDKSTITSKKIWKWTPASMSILFRKRSYLCGYPKKYFSFHSLRSGFLNSAILQAGDQGLQMKGVLESTAHIAGWRPFRASQMGYVRDCTNRSIICSRLVLGHEKGMEQNRITDDWMDPEEFHNIRLREPCWPKSTFYKGFQDYIDKRLERMFTENKLTAKSKRSIYDRGYTLVWKKFLQDKDPSSRQWWYLASPKVMGNEPSRRPKSVVKAARHFVALSLMENKKKVQDLEKVFLRGIGQYIKGRKKSLGNINVELERRSPKKKVGQDITTDGKGPVKVRNGRIRVAWSENEDLVLTQGKKDNQTWVEISHRLCLRSNVDCKDRWRNLLRKYGTPGNTFKAILGAKKDYDSDA
eukprot:TRINITY_DN4125_c0_g1_i1.p1 TRINITY_DN4125_c0_g1~~TRINITY_DN4125_c0_g1_i1.p1  ORF type:complete len:735 (-),score=68.07 TRINITY_DN4125_c0_g1_i1:594-2711(-)